VTEDELLGVFTSAAADLVRPDEFAPDALSWIGQQIALAAARGAGDPEIPNAAVARAKADAFLAALLDAARPRSIFQSVDQPNAPISAEALQDAYVGMAALSIWPFGKRPNA
jgi:hypothetical protein